MNQNGLFISIGAREFRNDRVPGRGVRVVGSSVLNPLTPNDPYRGRTAPLTSKVAFYIFIQQI